MELKVFRTRLVHYDKKCSARQGSLLSKIIPPSQHRLLAREKSKRSPLGRSEVVERGGGGRCQGRRRMEIRISDSGGSGGRTP